MSFVAISKVKYPAALQEQIHEVGLKMLPIARQQPGFIAVRFHQSCDADETMMYWEWESRADHEACMASENWAAIMAQSESVFSAAGIEFSIETYQRLA